ncbi:MAG TPA: carbohydrate binding family 9 domain-containing protein [Acidobacteriota bacterium]|nr:carbohydrate binding family 9 domain-containing protein [Acidobacteriota bacterium]
MHRVALAWALFLSLGMPLGSAQQNGIVGGLSLAAGRLGGQIELNGKLDEPAWSNPDIVGELIQQSPKPGETTPYKTTVRVLVGRDNIYIGFDCIDPDPSKIAVHTMQRDGDVTGDDTVAVVLDSYGDRRTGYYFRINAAGARVDGLIAGLAEPTLDWDGIWDARTARSTRGWSAEIVIPSRTLTFKRGLAAWNVNFERNIPRDRTMLRWASPTLDSYLYDLNRTGTLTGVGDLQQGIGLEISPFTVGRMKEYFQGSGSGRHWLGSPGLDVTYRVTPQMAAVFTANTDFAETEVDTRQINLTRFPLFFPERRTFFLEGSNQYEFGLGLQEAFIPFFSRRVGLYEEQQIPIDVGFKLNGRAGPWNIGMLDVQTRDTFIANAGAVVPGTNLFAGRVSFDVNDKLRVGSIFTNGNPDGVHQNRLAGFDAVWRTSEFLGNKNLQAGGWMAFSSGDLAPGNRTGWGVGVNYPNDLVTCSTSLNQFGEALDPALGFLPRPGTRRLDIGCEYDPRPSKSGPFRWIRQQFTEHEYTRVTNYRGEVESWRFFWAPINVRMESGDRFEFNWLPSYEFLPEPFEIFPGITLPVGSYRFNRFRFEFQTSRHRPWEFGTTSWFGTFYNGHLLQQENYLRFTSPGGTWQAGVSTEFDFRRLLQGNFVQRLWQLNLGYSFNPNLVLTSYLQYDTESQNVGNNMRLRWTIKPGNDLFIVWNRGWKRLILSRDDLNLIPESELLAVKLRWTFRR